MQNEVKASKPYIRAATFEDAINLSPRLRQADLQEIFHGSGNRPMDVLLEGVAMSEFSNAVIHEDRVVAIFGVVGEPGRGGSPWMLASPDLEKIARPLLRQAKGVLNNMLHRYGYLENYVWSGNEKHVQWLRWMGFSFDAPVPRGRHSEPYNRFYLKEVHDV